MLAVVPQITTPRPDGPDTIPITPVVITQTTSDAQPAAAGSNSATSPSTSAAPSPSKTDNKPNSKSGATAGAGTASTAAPLTAVGSQDSILGSWSTLSIPKSAGTATGTTAGGKPASRKSKSNSSPLLPTKKDDGPSTSGSVPPTATTGTFLAPKSRSKSRRPNGLHINSTPTAPRTLVPEPAPPPPSALNNKPLKPPQRLSSSSKDRRQPRKHASTERRQSTPYPLSAVTRRNRVSSGPIMGVYPSETGGSGIARRPSPVPPSSSHSDSSRSSDSYVSLKADGSARKSTAGPPPSGPLPSRPPVPQLSSNQQLIPAMTPKPSLSHLHLLAALRSQAQSPLRLPPPTPGLPRIFHPSPLNPNAPPSPYNPYQPIPRLSPLLSRHPGRHAHIVPLPSLTYPSAQQRPRALPPSEIDGQVWTSTQTGMEEYASDHPHDLVQRAIEMEARDELERVRIWCHDVFRAFLPNKNEERNAGEDNASAGGDAFFLLEKPPKIDLESLTPHRSRNSSGVGEIPVLVPYTMTDEERAAKDRALPKVPTVAVAAPTPDSLVPFPTVEGGRIASPYPPPPENHVVHLDSSSASSQMAVEVPPVSAGLTPDPSHLAPPLTTQKSFVSLTTPSPFGLPSPLRLPIMQTPMTPFYPLGSGNNGDFPTPPAQEPLPPILEPADQQKQTPDVIPVDAVQRVPSALERVSSYLGSTASLRAPSPETPPRIIHSSNSRREEDEEEAQPLVSLPSRTRTRSRSTDSIPYPQWRRVRSADSSSTISRAFTKTSRGRSPTRRSWKAASERAVGTSSHGIASATRIGVGMVMQRIDGTERITVMQPVLVTRPPTGAGGAIATTMQRGVGSGYSWVENLSSVGDENDRPRTASRSSRSRYSSPEDPAQDVKQRPETQLSVVTADLFYKAQATPVEEKPAESVPVAQVAEQPKPTTPETLKPAESRKEARMMILAAPSMNRPSGVSLSVLRRRKSHRAKQSVVSLPASGDEREASRAIEEDPSGKTKPEKPPVVKVQVPPFADVLPPALRTSFPSATSIPFVSPATSKAVQPILPLVRPAFHSPSVSSPASATASAPVHSLLFNKLVVLIAQFNSDLSLGRNKVPRWKRDFAEMDDKVRMVYDAFASAVERSRVEFRPWLRDHHPGASDEEEEGKTVMYVDDLWEKIASEVSARGNLSAHAVQEDIIRSVTSSWEFLASECLHSVQDVLSQLVTSIVDLHFRCAGDGNQLRAIVQSIADDQLHAQVGMTGRKLSEFGALEARSVFTSSHSRVRDNAAAILSHFKELRRQADNTILEQGPLRQSPVPLARAEVVKAKSLDHVVPVAGPSHSRESHTMSVPSSFTGQTLFSKGVPLSTVATSEDQGRQSDAVGGLRRRLAEQQRQRADSLRNANDAIQAALSSLRSVGFHDLSSPEQLLEKLVEPDPVDEVLEIMANVVAYLDIASIRFVDYITLHIEDHLVNTIGERINAAVVANLDLSGANIEERCLRWMA